VRGDVGRISAGIDQVVNDVVAMPETLAADVGKHSAKPPEVRDRIVHLMGDLPRIELFGRERVTGWDVWGNDEAIGDPDVEMF
jgi:N6-adenosine-specific RNA methylase IME4